MKFAWVPFPDPGIPNKTIFILNKLFYKYIFFDQGIKIPNIYHYFYG